MINKIKDIRYNIIINKAKVGILLDFEISLDPNIVRCQTYLYDKRHFPKVYDFDISISLMETMEQEDFIKYIYHKMQIHYSEIDSKTPFVYFHKTDGMTMI